MFTRLRQRNNLDPNRPFTRGEARAAGLQESMLTGPRFQRIMYNLYVSADEKITDAVRAEAALKVSPESARLSHHSAVEWWGGTAPESADTHVSTPEADARSRRRGIKSHISATGDRSTTHRRLPVSPPIQAFLELAAVGVGLVALVVAGDSLVKKKRFSLDALIRACDTYTGRGAHRARRAARLVREGVDSPMESRLRLLLVLAGFPEPVVNVVIWKADGRWDLRFDTCFPELMLIVEYDGRQHAENTEQWARDIERRELIAKLGYRHLTVTSAGIFTSPRTTLDRVRDTMIELGATNVPKKYRTGWERHFPGRQN